VGKACGKGSWGLSGEGGKGKGESVLTELHDSTQENKSLHVGGEEKQRDNLFEIFQER